MNILVYRTVRPETMDQVIKSIFSEYGTSNEITLGNASINKLRIPGLSFTLEPGGANITGVVTATTFSGALSGNATSATTATNANHVYLTDNESTSENNLIAFVENAQATHPEPPGPEEDPSFIPFELRDSTPKIKFFMFLGAIILFNYFMFFNETTKPIIEAIINGVSRGLTSPVLRDPDRPDWN